MDSELTTYYDDESRNTSRHVMTINEQNPDERPQERAERYGVSSLSTYELLALVLRSGRPGLPITDITRQLLADSCHSLHMLGRKSLAELQLTRGMGPVKSLQVQAIMELAKRYFNEDNTVSNPVITISADIDRFMRPHMASISQEEIWVVTLARSNRVVNKHRVTVGSATASVFDMKRCLKLALLDEASSIILVHNHPSGNLRPSPQDDQITRRLAEAARQLDLMLLDHVIIAHTGHYSYRDEGKM